MNIILGNPGSGKTKYILELSAKNNIPILCESEARLERLLIKANGYGFSIPRPILYTEVDSNVEVVYVDDIERLLQTMFRCQIKGISINVERKENIKDLDL